MLERFRLEEGWSTLFLVWAMVQVAAIGIIQAELIGGLGILSLIGTAAVLAGVLLAKSRFSSRTAHTFSLIYGLCLVIYLIGRALPDSLIWQDRIFNLVERQFDWVQKAFSGGTSRDGLIFVMHTSAVFWLLGYTAAWYTFRHPRVWRVVLPTGLVLLSVIYYYYGPRPLVGYLAIYVILGLLYVVRTHLVAQELQWRLARVRYDGSVRFSFLRSGFIAAVLALAVAWSLPTLTASAAVGDALSGTRGPWREFQDNWTRLFSSLRSYGAGANDPYQDTLVLGGPRTVGSVPIMDVYLSEPLPYVYWQALIFDTYEDGGWSIAKGETVLRFPDDGPLIVPPAQGRREVTQTVVNYVPNSSTLYGVPEIVASDRQMFVTWKQDSAGNALVHTIQSRFVLRQGDAYQTQSLYSFADKESLRQAGQDYPDWVRETYLQVPTSITDRTRELAQRLAEPYANPFDKAVAARDWLRQNITYNDQIAATPEGEEPLDYVLFVGKEGYCNYYASAMAMMMRTLGIPARVVGGYAQGQYDEETNSYRVRSSNLHTWVEVYFPGYGWILFEPTASIPVYELPESAGEDDTAFPSIPEDESELLDPTDLAALLAQKELEDVSLSESDPLRPLAIALSPLQIIGALVVAGLASVAVLGANQLNRRVESDVEKSYNRLGLWSRWLGVLFQPSHTPYERADMLSTLVPEGRHSIRNLTRQFVQQRFSPQRSTDPDFNPLNEWQLLRPLLLRRRARQWLEQQRKRLRRGKG